MPPSGTSSQEPVRIVALAQSSEQDGTAGEERSCIHSCSQLRKLGEEQFCRLDGQPFGIVGGSQYGTVRGEPGDIECPLGRLGHLEYRKGRLGHLEYRRGRLGLLEYRMVQEEEVGEEQWEHRMNQFVFSFSTEDSGTGSHTWSHI